MSPALFVSLPFILLLLIAKGTSTNSAKPESKQPSLEKVIDMLGDQDNEIIIVCKKKP